MPAVNIIGAGRVGRTFLRLLGPQVRDVASATGGSAEAAVRESGHGRAADLDAMRPADVWLLTVPDTQIAAAAAALARTRAKPAIAVHCSGFHTADVMVPLRSAGWHLASAHPNLSFADAETAARTFPGTPVGVEGDAEAIDAVEALMTRLGAIPFRIASERKTLYHAAAVFSNNFATVLQAVAREAWDEAGVPEAIARTLNASLLRATTENVLRHGPADALTGPAARGDLAVVREQGRAIADWNEEAGRLYRDLSGLAVRLKSTGRALEVPEHPLFERHSTHPRPEDGSDT